MQLFIYVDAASGLGDSASRGPLTTGKAHLRPFLRMLSLKSTSRLEAAYTEEKQAQRGCISHCAPLGACHSMLRSRHSVLLWKLPPAKTARNSVMGEGEGETV